VIANKVGGLHEHPAGTAARVYKNAVFDTMTVCETVPHKAARCGRECLI
jgi:hypothetical protein